VQAELSPVETCNEPVMSVLLLTNQDDWSIPPSHPEIHG
jgi:hypothetical protein